MSLQTLKCCFSIDFCQLKQFRRTLSDMVIHHSGKKHESRRLAWCQVGTVVLFLNLENKKWIVESTPHFGPDMSLAFIELHKGPTPAQHIGEKEARTIVELK